MKIAFIMTLMIAANSFAKSSNKATAEKMYQDIKKKFRKVPEITLSEAQSLKEKILFIDVREEKERNVSIIPGAISHKEFEKNPEKYKNRKIAVYCTIGYRSAKYVKKLKKRGIQAYNLEGSILGWVHDGKSVVNKNGNSVKNVHVYGRSWNYLPEGFKGEW